MSNNSMVCPDGGEIGRAQYLQAQAARLDPTTAMNPVLLKPGTDRRAFIVVRGQPAGTLEAGQYAAGRGHLREAAFAAYRELADDYELVVCEGAGSPAEINLRAGDYVNLGLAREFELPVVVVGDIDRGGILASLYGTWALLDPDDRATLKAFVINKFRGDVAVLEPGLEEITARTGVPFAGVIPWLLDVWLDSEDTLEVGHWRASTALSAIARDRLKVAVVRLPRISNATDVDALAVEPGVDLLVTVDPAVIEAADLVVLPGSRSTATDLAWLRARGLADVVVRRAAAGRPVLGICGGYQMLAHEIEDEVEGRVGVVPGLGLLPTRVDFGAEKVLARPTGSWGRTRSRPPTRSTTASRVACPATPPESRMPLRPNPFSTAGGSDRSGARCGTAPSRATTSGEPGSLTSRRRSAPTGLRPMARQASQRGVKRCSRPSRTPSRSMSTSMPCSPTPASGGPRDQANSCHRHRHGRPRPRDG